MEDLLVEPISKLFPQLLQSIPLTFGIAFDHPIVTDIIVSTTSDTPHFNKKSANALKRSSDPSIKTALAYKGQSVSLGMLYDLWLVSDDGSEKIPLRLYTFTVDHFVKIASIGKEYILLLK